jgi:putative tRNA adenosine deaminase-associated protein
LVVLIVLFCDDRGREQQEVPADVVPAMTEVTDAEVGEIDLAVVAYRDEGDWSLSELPDRSLDSVDTIAKELRRYPGESGALALISVAEDFVLLVRAQGQLVRVLLSDATAATDWSLARSAVDHIGVHVDDEEDQAPAGDLAIVADMGLSAQDMGALLDDYDLYPEEILSEVADSAGFGTKFDDLVGYHG